MLAQSVWDNYYFILFEGCNNFWSEERLAMGPWQVGKDENSWEAAVVSISHIDFRFWGQNLEVPWATGKMKLEVGINEWPPSRFQFLSWEQQLQITRMYLLFLPSPCRLESRRKDWQKTTLQRFLGIPTVFVPAPFMLSVLSLPPLVKGLWASKLDRREAKHFGARYPCRS